MIYSRLFFSNKSMTAQVQCIPFFIFCFVVLGVPKIIRNFVAEAERIFVCFVCFGK